MKIVPPEMSPKAANSSVGGLEGYTDLGDLSHIMTYVKPLANDAPASSCPHCLCTMVEIMLSCVCELIMMPNSKMTSAGMGFIEKR